LSVFQLSIVINMGLYPPTQTPLKLLLNYMCILPEHTIAQISHLDNTWWFATNTKYQPKHSHPFL